VYWYDGGMWRAMIDECPHRCARLSEGRVKEDGHIECPYHGWSFEGGTGRCSLIPQLSDLAGGASASPRACATALPAEVRHGVLYAWASELFGSEEPPDMGLLDQMVHDDVLRTPGVKYVDYLRDLPMDMTVLLENVLDPSHLPFTHHDTISSRGKAAPVPIKIGGPPTRSGFRAERYTSAPGVVSFVAPNHVMALTDRPGSYRDWNVVYATPARPGRCRIFVRVVFEVSKIPLPLQLVFQFAFSPEIPAFFTHLSNHRVLEDDNIFLHYQGRTLAPGGVQVPNWRERIYVPTSADAAVVQYRRWLDEFAGGGVAWARASQPEPPPTRAALIERYYSHTEHCASCAGALASARSMQLVTDFVVLLGVLGTALWDEVQWPCAASAVAAAGLKWLAKDVESKLTVGEYPPPRNRPSFDFADMLQTR